MTKVVALFSAMAQAGKNVPVALLLCMGVLSGPAAHAQSQAPKQAPVQSWSFKGPLGHFDLAAVQRGYAVFAGVCASCHGLTQVHFSDLAATGLTSAEIAALAESWQVPDGLDGDGRLKHRKANPDDALPQPYPTPQAARAANRGAVPPDLSRITQVYPGGADRVFALLTGYGAPASPSVGGGNAKGKPEQTLSTATGGAGGFANPYAIGHRTAMPPPLRDGAVVYADGTQATAEQEARDVTTFLAWVSNPHADSKRRLGVGVALYLCFLATLLVMLKRRIWSHVRK